MTSIDMQVNGETVTIHNLSPYASEWLSALLALDLNARKDLDAKVQEEFAKQASQSKLSDVYQTVLIKELRKAIINHVAEEVSIIGFPIKDNHTKDFELKIADDIEFCVGDGTASMKFQGDEVTDALTLILKLQDFIQVYLETGEY